MRVAYSILVASFIAIVSAATVGCADTSSPSWQAANPNIPTGSNVRLDLRLVIADGKPVDGKVTVTAARFDMGPDGMAAMTSPLRPTASSEPGGVSFLTDVSMAGRWALTISGKVEGQAEIVSGVVVFTAADRRSQNVAPATPNARRKILYYRNPMGLSDTSPVPKKDAMGMDYIPVYADEALTVPGAVRISLERIQRAGVRLEVVGRRNLSHAVRATGTVTHDESRLSIVTSKFSGFVEQLYVGVTGAQVRRGQPLARVWIESNDILAKEADYLIALRGFGPPGDVKRAEDNLRLFGVPESLIQELKRTGRPVRTITITAPRHGVVIEKPAIPGMRFAAGDVLFKIADHSVVWIIAQVPERDLAMLKVGEAAQIRLAAYADAPFAGRVSFISPELDLTARTVQVRIEVPNPGQRIKIGQYADVTLDALASGGVVAIPETAVVDNGVRQVAFIAKDGGVFEPRTILLGRRGRGYVEVRRGIAEGEKVVASGNFLIDAESNLQTALSTFAPADSGQ